MSLPRGSSALILFTILWCSSVEAQLETLHIFWSEMFKGAPDLTFQLQTSRRRPHRCPIHAVDAQPCKLACSKPLTRGVYALGLGMWSSAVNHSFDFAYQGDAVAITITATPSLSAPRSAPSTLCLSIIKVGIDPFTILSLSGCSHKAKTFLAWPDRWLFHLAFGLENGKKKEEFLFAPV